MSIEHKSNFTKHLRKIKPAKCQIFGFILLFVLFLYNGLSGQTIWEKYKDFNKGSRLAIGIHQSSFLNSDFSRLIESPDLGRNLGFHVGLKMLYFPFNFNITYFSSNFKYDYDSWRYAEIEEEVTVSHSGMEYGVSIYLFHFTKTVLPHVGIAYQESNFGVREFHLEEQHKDYGTILTETDSFVWSFGLEFNINKRLGINIVYKQSFNPFKSNLQEVKEFNQLLFGIQL